MSKILGYIRRYPIASAGVGMLLVFLVYLAASGGSGENVTPSVETPAPEAVVSPAPETAASPQAPPPVPSTSGPAGSVGPVGRPDPFLPLVKPSTGGGGGGASRPPGVLPPPAPLPPPLFPEPEPPVASPGGREGPPAAPATPAPPPKLAASAELMGIIGNGNAVAIIKVGNETFVVSTGETILQKIRVALIDATQGLVVLIEDGQRFELRTGEGNRPHVAELAWPHPA